MNFPVRHLRRLPLLIAMAAVVNSAPALAASPGNDPAALVKIRDAAMESDYAWQRTEDMTDLIGPRLSGSPGAAAAVTQVAEAMRKLGAKVTLQPVKVPHWVRGDRDGRTGRLHGPAGRHHAAHRADCAGRLGRHPGRRPRRTGAGAEQFRRTQGAVSRSEGQDRAVRCCLRPAHGRPRPGRPGLRRGVELPPQRPAPGGRAGRRRRARALGRRRRVPVAAHGLVRPVGRRAHPGSGRDGGRRHADGAPGQARPGQAANSC